MHASVGTWVAMTVAVDGHLPADTPACLPAALDDPAGGTVVAPGCG